MLETEEKKTKKIITVIRKLLTINKYLNITTVSAGPPWRVADGHYLVFKDNTEVQIFPRIFF